MGKINPPLVPLQQEFCVLLRHCASVQGRCSELIANQQAEIARLKQEQMRMRIALILRDTRLCWMEEDMHQLQALVPGLPKRKALAQKVELLVHRVQDLLREKLRREYARTAHAHGTGIARAADSSVSKLDAAALTEPDSKALEVHLSEADLVICQTGCVSHNDYWRLRQHCRRTGKQCILVEQPDALRIVRIQSISDDSPSASEDHHQLATEPSRELSLIPGATD